jgi:hypothetical protein
MSSWSRRAHRALPRVLVAAGRLELTDDELRFTPARTERWFGRRPWSVDLVDIAEVGVAERRAGDAMRGGLVRRLEVRTTGGEIERFVVAPGLADAVASVGAAADQAGSISETV